MKSLIPHAFIGLATLGIAVASAGCSKRDEIETYEVEVTARAAANRRPADTADDSQPTDAPDAILAAIIPRQQALWFFKLSGPTGEVEKHRATVDALLASFAFEGRLPKWTTPEGWDEERGGQQRLATLRPNEGARDVEIAISPLPRPAVPLGDLIVSNVGRWRQQLQLPTASPAEIADAMLEVPTQDGTAFVFFAAGERASAQFDVKPKESGGS
jgi:hypothetical protein